MCDTLGLLSAREYSWGGNTAGISASGGSYIHRIWSTYTPRVCQQYPTRLKCPHFQYVAVTFAPTSGVSWHALAWHSNVALQCLMVLNVSLQRPFARRPNSTLHGFATVINMRLPKAITEIIIFWFPPLKQIARAKAGNWVLFSSDGDFLTH